MFREELNAREAGFTLIEILMVVMLVSIISAVSIPQFIDFRTDAKNAAVQSSVGSMRSAIMNQFAQIKVRCGPSGPSYPTAAQINANDITNGGSPCTTAQVAVPADRMFFPSGAVPDNPWSGGATKNTVAACSGATTGCSQTDNTNCAGSAYAAGDSGWCYNPANGQIWANSQNNGQTIKENTY